MKFKDEDVRPNVTVPMSVTKARFAIGKNDARWRDVPDNVNVIDILRRMELQREIKAGRQDERKGRSDQ